MQPILHDRTRKQLDNYFQKPAHGLLLTGKAGSGKLFVARWVADTLDSDIYIVASEEGKSSITIDQIRELYRLTRTGNPLVVVIKDAQELGREAQNAFLKLLEEPPKNTKFILTATGNASLLETILSRTQHVAVLPPSKSDLLAGSTELSDASAASLLHTSEGLAGVFTSLANNSTLHEQHLATTQLAKKFYTASIYERHLMCIEYKYDKEWARDLLKFLSIIIRALLKNANSGAKRSVLISHAHLIEQTARNIYTVNGNPKIHLAWLCQKLS